MPLILHEYPLPGTGIGVWQIQESAEWFRGRLQLNKHDEEELSGIIFPGRILEFLASRYILRLLIGSTEEQTLLKDEHGRPLLQNSHLHVSVSHCKGYAAAMINERCPAGIDIEQVHPRVRKIISKYLSDEELAALGGENVTDDALILAWAVKEAVYKAHGIKGLSLRSHIHLGPAPTSLPGEIYAELDRDGEHKTHRLIVKKLEETILAYTLE